MIDPPSDVPSDISSATIEALEFPSFLLLLAAKTATDLGHEQAMKLGPQVDERGLRHQRFLYEEAERLIAAQPLVTHFERPLRPLLAELERGGRELGGRELVASGDYLRWGAEAILRIRGAEPPCPCLGERTADLPLFDELRHTLAQTFDPRGEIRPNATPRLAALRGKIRGTRDRLYGELRGLVDAHREHLSEDTIPLRGGRLVLMLQAGARGRVPGLTHGRSGSGQSFYFEPLGAVDLNNDLQQAIDEEEAEKRRILNELIGRLRDELPAVRRYAALVAELDRLQAVVRFAQAAEARLADLAPRHELCLKGARHPLLDPRLADLRRAALAHPGHEEEIIPLDLEFDATHRALVVTGPNAGGKTVALKTLGLLALLHQCGLPLPVAAGSRLPFFASLVATVGDDQDLMTDRSTFSGRLQRLREAWESAGADSLILLDELGSGTDPEEGAALSIALLEELLSRRASIFITTHLTQLAAVALEAEGAVCAAMEFDAESGRPTYRLLPGPPGGSEALALARRLGLPAAWLDRAETLLGSEHRDLRRLLEQVERTRRDLALLEERRRAELADAELLRRRLAEREAELIAERRQVGRRLQQELEEFQERTRRKMRQEVERLERKFASGRRKGLAAEAAGELLKEAPRLGPDDEPAGAIEVGRSVRHRRLGWEGTLEKLDGGRAKVRVAGKVLRCKGEDLAPSSGGGGRRMKPKETFKGGRTSSRDEIHRESPRELNLIGQRVEPALEALDRFLDQALVAVVPEVRVIHGHGTGQLRRAVREHLRGHAAVVGHRQGKPQEGGNGATVVALRG